MANRSPSHHDDHDSHMTRDEVLKRMLKMPPKPHKPGAAKKRGKAAGTKAKAKTTG